MSGEGKGQQKEGVRVGATWRSFHGAEWGWMPLYTGAQTTSVGKLTDKYRATASWHQTKRQ